MEGNEMKKLLAALLTVTLAFTPVGVCFPRPIKSC